MSLSPRLYATERDVDRNTSVDLEDRSCLPSYATVARRPMVAHRRSSSTKSLSFLSSTSPSGSLHASPSPATALGPLSPRATPYGHLHHHQHHHHHYHVQSPARPKSAQNAYLSPPGSPRTWLGRSESDSTTATFTTGAGFKLPQSAISPTSPTSEEQETLLVDSSSSSSAGALSNTSDSHTLTVTRVKRSCSTSALTALSSAFTHSTGTSSGMGSPSAGSGMESASASASASARRKALHRLSSGKTSLAQPALDLRNSENGDFSARSRSSSASTLSEFFTSASATLAGASSTSQSASRSRSRSRTGTPPHASQSRSSSSSSAASSPGLVPDLYAAPGCATGFSSPGSPYSSPSAGTSVMMAHGVSSAAASLETSATAAFAAAPAASQNRTPRRPTLTSALARLASSTSARFGYLSASSKARVIDSSNHDDDEHVETLDNSCLSSPVSSLSPTTPPVQLGGPESPLQAKSATRRSSLGFGLGIGLNMHGAPAHPTNGNATANAKEGDETWSAPLLSPAKRSRSNTVGTCVTRSTEPSSAYPNAGHQHSHTSNTVFLAPAGTPTTCTTPASATCKSVSSSTAKTARPGIGSTIAAPHGSPKKVAPLVLRSVASYSRVSANGASSSSSSLSTPSSANGAVIRSAAGAQHQPGSPNSPQRSFFNSLHLGSSDAGHSKAVEEAKTRMAQMAAENMTTAPASSLLAAPPVLAPAVGSPALGFQLLSPGIGSASLHSAGLDSPFSPPATPLSPLYVPYIEHIQVSYNPLSLHGVECKKLLMRLERFKKRSSVDLTTLSAASSGATSPASSNPASSCSSSNASPACAHASLPPLNAAALVGLSPLAATNSGSSNRVRRASHSAPTFKLTARIKDLPDHNKVEVSYIDGSKILIDATGLTHLDILERIALHCYMLSKRGTQL